MTSLDNIYIILVETSHPGNLGATARAMKNMGVSHLRLVQPPAQFLCKEATARAAGADDLLLKAQLFDSFAESVQDCHLIIGTTARSRTLAWPTLTPRAGADKALTMPGKVAIVFGREDAGLTNQELEHCHWIVKIPTNPTFSSLNLAAAVQILVYELRMKGEEIDSQPATLPLPLNRPSDAPAPAATLEYFYQHLEQTLIEIEFLDPLKPKLLMRRLRRLFNRVTLLESEVDILRGILTAIKIQRNKSDQS